MADLQEQFAQGQFGTNYAAPQALMNMRRTHRSDELMAALMPIMGQSMYYREWRFDGVPMLLTNDNFWTAASDATAADLAETATVEGPMIESIMGSNVDNYTSIIGLFHFCGDLNAGIEVRARSTVAVDELLWEIGFADVVTDKTLPVVSDVDTPTVGNGGDDVAVLHMNTDQTLKTVAIIGGDSGGSDQAATMSALVTPTINEFHTWRIQLIGNDVYGALFDHKMQLLAHGKITDGIEGGTVLAPYILHGTLAAGGGVLSIDRVAVWQKKVA